MSPTVFMVVVVVACLYFLPGLIASQRGHHNANAIFVLNLFLGWTILGWIGALVWSVTAVRKG